ncbi:MAG: tRNA lysidine(34) synthetase TilS [Proteobacteria bacterium]|nr:tRNA lysidine(34) synthetase TilS [Pseudomonadota bacterium]
MAGASIVLGRVRRTLLARQLLRPGDHVLAACSGGPDSAALLAALARLADGFDLRLSAASVNHGLRADAALDVELAREQARALSVGFHCVSVELGPRGPSLQSRARRARYQALLDLGAGLGAQRVATGHTQDDQAETVLARLTRGTGIEGLAGIDPGRADGVIRPLIDCRRADVRALATATFRRLADDASNRDARFLRTRVRDLLVPLAQQDPALISHLAALADDARSMREHLRLQAEALLVRSTVESTPHGPPFHLGLALLRESGESLRRATLRRWIAKCTGHLPGRAQLQALDAVVTSGRGEVWLAGGWSVRPQRGRFVLSRGSGRARGRRRVGH